jgi:hypothetical protein
MGEENPRGATMKATTSDNRKLKRLATQYAEAYHLAWMALQAGKRVELPRNARKKACQDAYKKARQKLHEAIDALTTVDFTPRAVEDSL